MHVYQRNQDKWQSKTFFYKLCTCIINVEIDFVRFKGCGQDLEYNFNMQGVKEQ